MDQGMLPAASGALMTVNQSRIACVHFSAGASHCGKMLAVYALEFGQLSGQLLYTLLCSHQGLTGIVPESSQLQYFPSGRPCRQTVSLPMSCTPAAFIMVARTACVHSGRSCMHAHSMHAGLHCGSSYRMAAWMCMQTPGHAPYACCQMRIWQICRISLGNVLRAVESGQHLQHSAAGAVGTPGQRGWPPAQPAWP